MAGSAGSIPSIASAPNEIKSAMSGTNSPVRRAGVAAGWVIPDSQGYGPLQPQARAP